MIDWETEILAIQKAALLSKADRLIGGAEMMTEFVRTCHPSAAEAAWIMQRLYENHLEIARIHQWLEGQIKPSP